MKKLLSIIALLVVTLSGYAQLEQAIYATYGADVSAKYVCALSYDYSITNLGGNEVFWQPLAENNIVLRTKLTDKQIADISAFVDQTSVASYMCAALNFGSPMVKETLAKSLSGLIPYASCGKTYTIGNTYHGSTVINQVHVIGTLIAIDTDGKTAVLQSGSSAYVVLLYSLI